MIFNAALPDLLEHDMIADMLRGRIESPEDLTAFLSQALVGFSWFDWSS